MKTHDRVRTLVFVTIFGSALFACSIKQLKRNEADSPVVFLSKHLFRPDSGVRGVIGDIKIHESEMSLWSLKGHIAVTTSRKLHLELENPIGQTVFLAVSDGENLWLSEPPKRQCDRVHLSTGRVRIPSMNIEIPVSSLFSIILTYPSQLSQPLQGPWKPYGTETTDSPERRRWVQGGTIYEFAHLYDFFPASIFYMDGVVSLKQEFIRWKEAPEGVLATRWLLRTDWKQNKRQFMWTWEQYEPLKEEGNPQLFQKPALEFCPGS